MIATVKDWLVAAACGRLHWPAALAAALYVGLIGATQVPAQERQYPPLEQVVAGYEKVPSRSPSGESLCNVWVRESDAQVYLELPRDYASKKYFIALTVSSGDRYAGLQAGDYYVYWRLYDNRLALIAPNLEVRSTGEPESKASVKRIFTDQVLLDVPVVTMVPRGGPLIDADALFVGQASKFFGQSVRPTDPRLVRVKTAKSFEKNTELAFEIVGAGGKLQTIHYSLSEVPENNGYQPRKADTRVGYFTTGYMDLGKYDNDEKQVRYINRWRLEKRDPKLKVSPPIEPIVFYIEHTTPVRYRRWVKQGIEYWNDAFEKVGFSNAIEVRFQDAQTGLNMDKDPEDVQYNFVRWLNNDISTAIGPSRVNPMTGQILDADIILTDGWIRYFNFQFQDLLPEIAMESLDADTEAWLARFPNWDPRLRAAAPADRAHLQQQLAMRAQQPHAGHLMTRVDPNLVGRNPFDGLIGRTSQINGLCLASRGKQLDVASARLALELLLGLGDDEPGDDDPPAEGDNGEPPAKAEPEKPKVKKPEEDKLDGMPESFVGMLLADLVAHEVGHTLGLRHNFKASGAYSLAEINSEDFKGKKPLAASVMDYLPVNINFESGQVQGDWTMIGIGPYDYWAIEYGYEPEEPKAVKALQRVSEPELQYATDEDTGGTDPLARRYDFSRDPLDFATNQMRLVDYYRSRLIDKFVKSGDSWAKARRGYQLTLSEQAKAISMMSNWVGGTFVFRDKKGDAGERKPLEPVPAAQQRAALEFVLKTAFRDEAFGLTPELLQTLSSDKWIDEGFSSMGDSTFPVHDRILAIQASALTALMNPTTLRRVHDNELMVPADQDAITLPELVEAITGEIWRELETPAGEQVSNRQPYISSLRRALQREQLQRLIDLAVPGQTADPQPISTLAMQQLRRLGSRIKTAQEGNLDAYSAAHLSEAAQRIAKSLDAGFISNLPAGGFGGGGGGLIIFGSEPAGQ